MAGPRPEDRLRRRAAFSRRRGFAAIRPSGHARLSVRSTALGAEGDARRVKHGPRARSPALGVQRALRAERGWEYSRGNGCRF